MSIEQSNQIRALAKRVDELEKLERKMDALVKDMVARLEGVENAVTAPSERRKRA
jgi:prefoldin subunit 5